ncbi:MAG: DUF1801 domain-containing protein [Cyanobacteria bacterium P01_D01_bin.44]
MCQIDNPAVSEAFQAVPEPVREKLHNLRSLILQVASDLDDIGTLEETLKWGQPSYLVKGGSTIRLGWKPSVPDQYAIYFHCKTKLVETYREVYGDLFEFEGNRAIVFNVEAKLPTRALKHCIALALTYHRVKHLPMLGI